MRSLLLFVVAGGLLLASSAHSQSLAELAKKEKARRARIAADSKNQPATVIDEHALRSVEASTFSAVQVSGAPKRAREVREVELGRPVPENPNRTRSASSQKRETKSKSTKSPAGTELGRGWTTGNDNTTQMRSAPPGTKPIHPTSPRTMVGRDRNGNPIYR